MNDLASCFDHIYGNGLWGKKLYSGPGSWHAPLVEAYVDTTFNFLESEGLSGKCKAIDLGCGDFNIGSNIARKCESIWGIDISAKIIDYCRHAHERNGITFSCEDARTFTPRPCDVVFIRQVFQHLSNEDIQLILANISDSCRYIMVTEHLPWERFTANINIASGTPHTRMVLGSGVDIMQPPFEHSFTPFRETLNYYGFNGNIRTTVYRSQGSASN